MNSEERLRKYLKNEPVKSKKERIKFIDYCENQLEQDLKEILNQNQQFKDNWNKLEEWLKEMYEDEKDIFVIVKVKVEDVLSKMQEIGGSNE